MTVISSGKLPVTAKARDCFVQLAFSSVLKKLFLSMRVVENAGVLPAAAVQGCGQCSITDTAHVLPFQLQWDFSLSGIISSKGEPHSRARDILNVKHRTSHWTMPRKKGHTKAGGNAKQLPLEYEDPQDAWKEQELQIFNLCGHQYLTDKNVHWISGWMIPAKHLHLVQKGILNTQPVLCSFEMD